MADEVEEQAGPLRVEVRSDTAVAVVTLDRPPVNAINFEVVEAIRETFDSFRSRRDVNCVVLTAAGKVFCGGADLKSRADSEEITLDRGRPWRDAKEALFDCAIPVIGALHGTSLGAGVGLLACCDFVIASDQARVALTEINVGLLGGGSALMRLVGAGAMRRMYYTGDFIGADELFRLGAVQQVVSPEELLPVALELATRIAAKSPIGLRLAKESLARMEEFLMPWNAAYRMEQDYTNRLAMFEDAMEGTRAFLEKRPAEWKWR